jgi:hypothetical protein
LVIGYVNLTFDECFFDFAGEEEGGVDGVEEEESCGCGVAGGKKGI